MNSPHVWVRASLGLATGSAVRPRHDLLIENLALRQQLAVFKRQNARPKLSIVDKVFWLLLRRLWPSWKTALIVVSPDTVVRWHPCRLQIMLNSTRTRLARLHVRDIDWLTNRGF